MLNFEELNAQYADLWQRMQVRPERVEAINEIAKRLIGSKPRYQKVSEATGVPWFVLAVLHARETDGDFAKHLHNGDPLTARTINVPAGRPASGTPPFTWEESAIDALTIEPHALHLVKKWTIERTCFEIEKYDGFGYRIHHPQTKSPYLWSFSNIYERGKYLADGRFDPSAIDDHSGIMPLLQQMMKTDASIQFGAPAEAVAQTASALASGSTGDQVRELQTALGHLNFPVGNVDGIFGPRTSAAVLAFQSTRGLEATGAADSATQQALGLVPAPQERAAAIQESLRTLVEVLAAKGAPVAPAVPSSPAAPSDNVATVTIPLQISVSLAGLEKRIPIAVPPVTSPGAALPLPSPTPTPPSAVPGAPFPPLGGLGPPLPIDRGKRTVDLLFATTRKPELGSSGMFSGERNENLITYGTASVHVPGTHTPGNIELPKKVRLFSIVLYSQPRDRAVHFVIEGIAIMPADQWAARAASYEADEALVFVHGFNTSFEEAVYRNAQIVWDIKFKALPILFSWPSRGAVVDYKYDLDSALQSRFAFLEVLRVLQRRTNIKRFHVLAHSMGNVVVLEALASKSRSKGRDVAELIMAAPDLEHLHFKTLTTRVRAKRMTLYASALDKALAMSKWIAGNIPRAGDLMADGRPLVTPGIQSIDATAVGEELFGFNHSIFATTKSIMNDVALVLKNSGPPHERLAAEILEVPEGANSPDYWKYV